MKKTFCRLISAALLLVTTIPVSAAEISVDSSTILKFEKRAIPGDKTETLLPATQFLAIDADKLADGNLSLHLYGWGRGDISDKSYDTNRFGGSLTYGYLQYRFSEANADVRAGRLFVREGIVNEQIDGLSVRSELPLGFGVAAFGGAPVHTRHIYGEQSDGKGSTIFGGRANYRYRGMFEIGASGVYEGAAPTLISHSNGNHRLLGGDIWLSPFALFELVGHTSYNPETRGVAEHTYLLNIKPLHHLVLSGEFNEHRERNFLYAWSMFSGSALDPAEKSRSIGGSASYQAGKNVEVAADYKHYSRAVGNADRVGGDLRLNMLDNSVRCGLGYHYLRAGQGFAIADNLSASFHELRGYAMHDTKGYFAAVDVLGYFFKDKIYDQRSAWEATASLGYHLSTALALSGDVSYGRNPQFTEETKGLIRLTYNMTYDGKGGKK